ITPPPPPIWPTPPPPTPIIVITTTSPLPNAVVGRNYLGVIEIAGPISSASWGSYGLPSGISYVNPPTGSTCKNLCYYIGGTPTTAGTSNVTFYITTNGQTTSKQFVLTVEPGVSSGGGGGGGGGTTPPPPVWPTPPPPVSM